MGEKRKHMEDELSRYVKTLNVYKFLLRTCLFDWNNLMTILNVYLTINFLFN